MSTLGMVTVVVNDYDEAIAYYRDAVGFALVEDSALTPEKRWVVMETGPGGARILIAKAATQAQLAAVGNQTGGRVSFFLYTADFDSDYERMLAAGVTFVESPRQEDFGKVVVFTDMFGNKWDFIERRSA